MRRLRKLTLKELKESINHMECKDQRMHIGGSGISGISTFELSCLAQYTCELGDMNLTQQQFSDIASAATSGNTLSSQWVEIDGVMYEAKTISFYNNANYDQALGTATVYYDSCGNAVGMHDTYDFNAMPEGERSDFDEFVTNVGSYLPGSQYDINYGIHQ